VTGLALGILALLGLVVLVVRRLSLVSTTGAMDWVVLLLLLLQTATGLYVAFALRWARPGTSTRRPVARVARPALAADRRDGRAARGREGPRGERLRLVALLPLSRLVHATVIPLSYLRRPPSS